MFTLAAKQKGLQLIVYNDPDVPQYLKTDAVKLRQVLINLLNNALKFTREGNVTLQIVKDYEPCEEVDGCRLLFAVIDTGPASLLKS